MAASEITLTNSYVNGGVAVKIFGGSVNYQWSNLTRPTAAEGSYDITESHYGGFENPKISVDGILDADNVDVLTNIMTFKLLIDFAAVKQGTTTLKISFGSTPLVLGGRPSSGYSTAGANTLDTTNGIDIQIEGFTIRSSSADARYGQKVTYTITCHETK